MAGSATRLGAVLQMPEFRALWFAELLSVCGDQLARVAVSVLVYSRTGSAALTTLTYALTFLPALLGGTFLSGLADRFRRRELLIALDIGRGVLSALMAIPGLPLPLFGLLVALLSMAGGPFKATQLSLMYQVLGQRRYSQGLSVRTISNQLAQLAGFAAGGAVVLALTPHVALGINSATFMLAAIVVGGGVRSRPALAATTSASGADVGVAAAARLIWRDRRLRGLIALAWLVGIFVVPEGLAAPYAGEIGLGVVAVGILMAADPAGSIIGAWLVGRLTDERRQRLLVPLALFAGVPLIGCVVHPNLPTTVLLLAASGVASTAYLIETQSSFMERVPEHSQGAAAGLGSAGVQASQGIAIGIGGVLADAMGAGPAIALSGGVGVLMTGLVSLSWLRARRP